MPQFLSLPYGVRLRIYNHLFCGRGVLQVYDSGNGFTEGGDIQDLPVQLLRVSRQVSHEAATVFYSGNRFVVSDYQHHSDGVNHVLKFLQNIGLLNRGHIRVLEIDWVAGIENATTKFDMPRVVDLLNSTQGPFASSLQLTVHDLVKSTSCRISETLEFLNENFRGLEDLTLRLPGQNAGRMDLNRNCNLRGYFQNSLEGPFSAHSPPFSCRILFHLDGLRSIQKLSVGNTTDFNFMEREAYHIGVKQLRVFWTEYDEVREIDIGELESRGWIFDFQAREAQIALQSTRSRLLLPLPSSPGRTGFLKLPPEIRQIIYRRLLVRSSISTEHITNHKWRPLPGIGLLLTSHQISQEACAVLYGDNYFILRNSTPDFGAPKNSHIYPVTIYGFLNAIGPSNRCHIRNLAIDWAVEVPLALADAGGEKILRVLCRGQGGLRRHLADALWRYTREIESCIAEDLELLGRETHHFNSLTLIFPGVNAAASMEWLRSHNPGFFDQELFADSHVIQHSLKKIKHVEKLTVCTTDFGVLERCARQMGVKELACRWTSWNLRGRKYSLEYWYGVLEENGWSTDRGYYEAKKALTSTE